MGKSGNKKNTKRIFLSYTSSDMPYAEALMKHLYPMTNISVWDDKFLRAGEDWESILRKELTNCDLFVAIVTPHYLTSSFSMQEIGAAWGLGKPILQIVTDKNIVKKIPINQGNEQYITQDNLEEVPNAVNAILHQNIKGSLLAKV